MGRRERRRSSKRNGDGISLRKRNRPKRGKVGRGRRVIIRPKRRAEAGSLEREIDLVEKCSFAKMMKSIVADTKEVNRVLLDEFMIQGDGGMYIHYPITIIFGVLIWMAKRI